MAKEIDMEMNDVVDLDAAFAQFWREQQEKSKPSACNGSKKEEETT